MDYSMTLGTADAAERSRIGDALGELLLWAYTSGRADEIGRADNPTEATRAHLLVTLRAQYLAETERLRAQVMAAFGDDVPAWLGDDVPSWLRALDAASAPTFAGRSIAPIGE